MIRAAYTSRCCLKDCYRVENTSVVSVHSPTCASNGSFVPWHSNRNAPSRVPRSATRCAMDMYWNIFPGWMMGFRPITPLAHLGTACSMFSDLNSQCLRVNQTTECTGKCYEAAMHASICRCLPANQADWVLAQVLDRYAVVERICVLCTVRRHASRGRWMLKLVGVYLSIHVAFRTLGCRTPRSLLFARLQCA